MLLNANETIPAAAPEQQGPIPRSQRQPADGYPSFIRHYVILVGQSVIRSLGTREVASPQLLS